MEAYYQLPPHVISEKVSAETVLLNPCTGKSYTLDVIGTFIFNLLIQGNSIEQVVLEGINNFDVSKSKLRSDVTELVQQMLATGILIAKPT